MLAAVQRIAARPALRLLVLIALALQVSPALAQSGQSCWTGTAFQLCPSLKHGDLNAAIAYAISQSAAQAASTLTAPLRTGPLNVQATPGGTSLLLAGQPPDPFYSPNGTIVPNGAVAVRAVPDGCLDHGAVLSLIEGDVSNHAGIDGGCDTNPLGLLANYNSFDAVTSYVSSTPANPKISVTSGVTFDTTHARFATPLTAAQLALLHPNMYVLTSAAPRVGSILTGWAADGSSITVAGWITMGSGNTAPIVPSASTVYIGAITHGFAENMVCGAQPSPTVDTMTCMEMDVVNNRGGMFAGGGLSIIGIGTGGFAGAGLSIGGNCGYNCAFATGVNVANFRGVGVQIGQTPGVGGIAELIAMNTGTPFALQNIDTGTVTLSTDPIGTLTRRSKPGTATVQNYIEYGTVTGTGSLILNSVGVNSSASGGLPLVNGSVMRVEAAVIGRSTATTDGASWKMTGIYSVSNTGGVTQIGTTASAVEAASGVFTSCVTPSFGVTASGIYVVAGSCSSAPATPLDFAADLKMTAAQ